MKRGTPDHPKVAHLCQLLNIGKAEAIGTLELLWHFTAKFAPKGDIGKYPDSAIARAVEWQRPTGERGVTPGCKLSDALVTAKWLDRCPVHRLIVHNWSEHADQSVARNLARHKLAFVQPVTSLPEPEPEPEPLPEPISTQPSPQAAPKKKRTPPTKLDPEREAWFTEWYALYPKHEDPGGARKRFLELIKTREECDLAIEATKQGKGGITSASSKEFIPYPVKWLKRTPWKPDIPEPETPLFALATNQQRPAQQTFAERNEQLRNQRFAERILQDMEDAKRGAH